MDTEKTDNTSRGMAELACHECRRRKSKVSSGLRIMFCLSVNSNLVQSDYSLVSAMQQVWSAVRL